MAEVRKKVVEDKYNTSNIQIKEKKNKNSVVEKNVKKQVKNEEKKNLFEKFLIFCNGVKSEFKKVHWTKKNDLIKYSVASIFFILFCSGFFYLINVLFAFVQTLFK